MSIFRITIILNDTIPAQATLLSNIQSTLSSIASNPIPTGEENNIAVKKIS